MLMFCLLYSCSDWLFFLSCLCLQNGCARFCVFFVWLLCLFVFEDAKCEKCYFKMQEGPNYGNSFWIKTRGAIMSPDFK